MRAERSSDGDDATISSEVGGVQATFGSELRKRRERAGYNLTEFCAEIHYSRGYLSRVERGEQAASLDLATKADDVLGCGRTLRELAQRERASEWLPERPVQLPPGVSDFTGRTGYLRELNAALDTDPVPGAPRVIVIEGPPGSGKTTLAVHWAHGVARRFSDGVLFGAMHGFGPGDPATTSGVLAAFLRDLTLTPIPEGDDARTALFRSLTSNRKLLVLVDDVATAQQIAPLLPTGPGSVVLVTTRVRLSNLALPAATRVCLTGLGRDEARLLLTKLLGAELLDTNGRAAGLVMQRCGWLPLALRIAAEQVARQEYTLTALAAQLASNDRLDVLSTPDLSVRPVLECSYRALATEPARAWRLLSLHTGPHIDLAAAAAMLGIRVSEARRLMDALVDAHLLETAEPNHVRWHELVRAYAAECAVTDESAEARTEATRRLTDWYLGTAQEANNALGPYRGPTEIPVPADGLQPREFDNRAAALAWCESESHTLVALARHAHEQNLLDHAWRLATVQSSYYSLRKNWRAWISSHTTGLDAARAARNQWGIAWCHHGLGVAMYELRRLDEAHSHLDQALRIRDDIGDHWGVGWSRHHLGAVYLDRGDYANAEAEFQRAINIFNCMDHPYGAAIAQAWLGTSYRRQQRLDDALTNLEHALDRAQHLNNADAIAAVIVRLAVVHRDRGDLDQAMGCFDRAHALRVEQGDDWGSAEVLLARGRVLHEDHRHADAQANITQALTIYDDLADPRAADARAELAALEARLPDTPYVAYPLVGDTTRPNS